jgi:ribosomal protein S6
LEHKTQDEDKQAQTLEKAKGGIRNGQSKKHWQLWVHKTQDEDKQAQTLEKAKGGIRNGQSVASVSWIVHS